MKRVHRRAEKESHHNEHSQAAHVQAWKPLDSGSSSWMLLVPTPSPFMLISRLCELGIADISFDSVKNLMYSEKGVAYKFHAGWLISRTQGEFINGGLLINLGVFSVEILQKERKV